MMVWKNITEVQSFPDHLNVIFIMNFLKIAQAIATAIFSSGFISGAGFSVEKIAPLRF
jgi:hypothetical protein